MPYVFNVNMFSYLKFIFIMFISIMFLAKRFLISEFLSQILFYLFLEIIFYYDCFDKLLEILKIFLLFSNSTGIFILNYIFRYFSFYYKKIFQALFYLLYYFRIFTLKYIFKYFEYVSFIFIYAKSPYCNKSLHKFPNTGERYFYCPKCVYEYYNTTNIKKHTVNHTGRKMPTCSICDYNCKSNSYSRYDSLPSINRNYKNIRYHMKSHTSERKGLLTNICFFVFVILLCHTFILSINAHLSQNAFPHPEFKAPQSFQPIHYKSLLFAFRRSNVHPFPNTSPQARKTILLLLLICGDNSAAINPGPYSLPLQNPCTSCDGIVVRHNTLNNSWHCINCNTINYAPHSPISPVSLSNSFSPLSSSLQSSIDFTTLRSSTPMHTYNLNNPPFSYNGEHRFIANPIQHSGISNLQCLQMFQMI